MAQMLIFEVMKPKHLSKSWFLLTCLLLSTLSCFADTFVVTSNADSGPGTLREAITNANANGTGTIDYIHFSISDTTENGRTIEIKTELPDLTSNIVIDGSTQLGSKFGVSDAKIKLTVALSSTAQITAVLKILRANHIKVLGIFFTEIFDPSDNQSWHPTAIRLWYNNDLTIGEPGKGNYFSFNQAAITQSGKMYGLSSTGFIENIKIQSNILGLDKTGSKLESSISINTPNGSFGFINFNSIELNNCSNLTIGGNLLNEGNHLQSVYISSDTTIKSNTCLIKNNFIGLNYVKSKALFTTPAGLFLSSNVGTDSTNVLLQNNKFEMRKAYANNDYPFTVISNVKGFIDIKSNQFNKLLSELNDASNTSECIKIKNCEKGIIGGPNTEDANSVSLGVNAGVLLENNSNIKITRNSIFCNKKGIIATSAKVIIPEVKILNGNGTNYISGKATPNCIIEVFQTPLCVGCNNGQIFMGQTVSDNAGNWSFTGNFTSAVTATATTADSITGEFAVPSFIKSNNINNPTCNQSNGSITGTQFVSGTKYYWIKHFNGNNDTVYNQLDLINLGPGMYEFVVEQTKYCKKSDTITLTGLDALLTKQNTTIQHPFCQKLNGSIKNLTVQKSNYKTYWLSAIRDTISTNFELLNVGPGNYKLLVSDIVSGCSDSSDWITLINQPGPKINSDSSLIFPDTCSQIKGGIEGLKNQMATGTAPFSYQWLDANNNIVSTQQKLSNVGQGAYRFIITDANNCADTSNQFIIGNVSSKLMNPVYSDQSIRTNTSAILTIMNPQQGTYYLYSDASSVNPIDQNATGNFTTAVLAQTKTYYVEVINGPCMSERVPIKISVYDKTTIYVPTAFTPNRDGLNDFLGLVIMGPARLEFFNIYNRWGQLVFSSSDASKGWDGKIKGIPQPSSSFSWVLKAKDELTGEQITMNGSFVLIR